MISAALLATALFTALAFAAHLSRIRRADRRRATTAYQWALADLRDQLGFRTWQRDVERRLRWTITGERDASRANVAALVVLTAHLSAENERLTTELDRRDVAEPVPLAVIRGGRDSRGRFVPREAAQ